MRQCNAFLEGIESQIGIPILRGYLKLYTTLPMKKLASFMDVADDEYDSFVGKLLSFKVRRDASTKTVFGAFLRPRRLRDDF